MAAPIPLAFPNGPLKDYLKAVHVQERQIQSHPTQATSHHTTVADARLVIPNLNPGGKLRAVHTKLWTAVLQSRVPATFSLPADLGPVVADLCSKPQRKEVGAVNHCMVLESCGRLVYDELRANTDWIQHMRPVPRTLYRGDIVDRLSNFRHVSMDQYVVILEGIQQHRHTRKEFLYAAVEIKPNHVLTPEMVTAGLNPCPNVERMVGTLSRHHDAVKVAMALSQLYDYMVHARVPFGYLFTGKVCIFLEIEPVPGDEGNIKVYYNVCPAPNLTGPFTSPAHALLNETFAAWLPSFFVMLNREIQLGGATLTEEAYSSGAINWQTLQGGPRWPTPAAAATADHTRRPSSSLPLSSLLSSSLPSRRHGLPSPPDHIRVSPIGYDGTPYDPENAFDLPTRAVQHDRRPAGGPQLVARPPADSIATRGYCPAACLLRLKGDTPLPRDTPLPHDCPYAQLHANNPVTLNALLDDLAARLPQDSRYVDHLPLITTPTTCIVKVCHRASGHTLILKSAALPYADSLVREFHIYEHLSSLQGTSIPVCLGFLHLDSGMTYNDVVYRYFLPLQYAGEPLDNAYPLHNDTLPQLRRDLASILPAVHAMGVCHNDVALRNLLFHPDEDRCYLMDFSQSLFVHDASDRGCISDWVELNTVVRFLEELVRE